MHYARIGRPDARERPRGGKCMISAIWAGRWNYNSQPAPGEQQKSAQGGEECASEHATL